MENASKALLIAGSILLALMILSLIVYVSTSTSRMVQAQEEKKATEEIAAFNRQYEAYNKKKMYGTDIITVYNKADDYNKKGIGNINIIIYDKDNNEIPISYESSFKNKTFECLSEQITYDNTGKINQMKFKEK